MLLYHFLDWFFIVFHSALIIFNVLGWIHRKTRKLNLLTLFITGFSWFVLGIFYGWGYCFLTDWHYDILLRLSTYPSESSYIAYILRRIFSIYISFQLADLITLLGFLAALALSITFNINDFLKKLRNKS